MCEQTPVNGSVLTQQGPGKTAQGFEVSHLCVKHRITSLCRTVSFIRGFWFNLHNPYF